jgi:hypothetical protein
VAKRYTVINNGEVLFGPETDFAKVKTFTDSLNPAIKSKCNVKVETIAEPAKETGAAAVEHKEEPAVKETVSAKVTANKEEKPKAPGPADADAVFGSFLEGGGQSDFWKPKDGRNIIRILPIGGVLPSDWVTPYPFVLGGVHSNVGLSLRDTVYCARLTHNKACPICNFVFQLYNTKDDNDIKLAKRIKGYTSIISNIIDLSDIEKGVQKYAFGKTLARKIKSYMDDEEFKPLLDPERGHNMIIIKKTVDGYPNYDDSRPEVKTSSLTQLYAKWREEAYDLKKEIKEKSYDELIKILADTKKAILSTSPEDLGEGRPARAHSAAPATEEGAVVEEVSIDELNEKLDKI